MTIVKLVMVEVALLTKIPPLKVARPEPARVVKEAAPAVKALAPMLMAPKLPPILPEARTPTPVSEEFTTALPSVVAFKVLTPLMLSARPVARLKLPEA